MDKQVDKKIDSFFKKFHRQKYKKGEILVRGGDAPQGILYLTEGIIKEYGISKKGDEVILTIYKPGAFFPMSWAINNTTNNYYYEAMTDAVLWRVPKENAIEFIKMNPDILYDLLSRVYQGTDGLFLRMMHFMSGDANSKLIVEIIILAKRLGKKKGTVIEVSVTEKDLAALAGMTRETVSRELSRLKKEKLLVFAHHTLTIKSLEQLENELHKL